MMHITTIAISVMLLLAVLPLLMILQNLRLLRPPAAPPAGNPVTDASSPLPGTGASPRKLPGGVSVLIPARDEAGGIVAAVQAVLTAGAGVTLEVVVLDDHSTDATAALVRELAANDPRVRLESAPELPGGWAGKPHACWVLAERARYETLLWLDADVRLTAPDAVARLSDALRQQKAALISGVPRQHTGSWLEVLIVPQILLVLLGYLPITRMRVNRQQALGVGCGQLFVADRAAYFQAGGHQAICNSRHDGVHLPRTFRAAGLHTDLIDLTPLASCRMYGDARSTWAGFAKNATAGMGSPRAIGVWTVLLLGGHVLPWIALLTPLRASPLVWIAAMCATLSSVLIAWRFQQGVLAAVLRPLGLFTLVLLQWVTLLREAMGHRPTWRGRTLDR